MKQLQKKAINHQLITVKRENETLQLESTSLVPGDIIQIQNNTIMPCDCLILEGEALIDEHSLTGESVPILKTQLSPHHVNIKDHTLFDGTKVLLTQQ